MWTKEIEREQGQNDVEEVDDFITTTTQDLPARLPVRLRDDQRNRLLTRMLEEVLIPTVP